MRAPTTATAAKLVPTIEALFKEVKKIYEIQVARYYIKQKKIHDNKKKRMKKYTKKSYNIPRRI